MSSRFNPVEVLIFLGVAFLFGGSVYQLFHEDASSPATSAEASRGPASASASIEQLEYHCESPQETPVHTKAESLNIQGTLCIKKNHSPKRITVRNRNAQGQLEATAFLDPATSHFTTELLKLSPGENVITIETFPAHSNTGSAPMAEIQVIRE